MPGNTINPGTQTTGGAYGPTQTQGTGVPVTDAQLQSAAVATGIDLYLSRGTGVDFVTYNAETTAQLQAAGYSPQQISNTLSNIRAAYDRAEADDNQGRGPSSFSSSDPNKQVNYDQFVKQVGSEVLPAGAGEPTYLGRSVTSGRERELSSWGASDGGALTAGADYQSTLTARVNELAADGIDDHGLAVYRQNFLAAYFQKLRPRT